jgi:hypothetical protein
MNGCLVWSTFNEEQSSCNLGSLFSFDVLDLISTYQVVSPAQLTDTLIDKRHEYIGVPIK